MENYTEKHYPLFNVQPNMVLEGFKDKLNIDIKFSEDIFKY